MLKVVLKYLVLKLLCRYMFKLAGACSKARGQVEGVENKTRELLERVKDMTREQTAGEGSQVELLNFQYLHCKVTCYK